MWKRIDRLALALLALFMSVQPDARAQQVTIPTTVTHLIVTNSTGKSVTMGVVLPPSGQDDGCTTNVNDLRMAKLEIGLTGKKTTGPQPVIQFGPTTNGYFKLKARTSYELVSVMANPVTGNNENCLQGLIISFGQFNQCPTQPTTNNPPQAFPPGGLFSPGPKMPNGVCAFEPTLNLPGTINGGSTAGAAVNEACDITCVNGANAYLELFINSPQTPQPPTSAALPWTYDANGSIGVGQSFSTKNSWVKVEPTGTTGCDDNCVLPGSNPPTDRPGIQPYGCSQCNIPSDPDPPCQNLGIGDQYCSAQNGLPPNTGCSFNRSPQTLNPITQQFGGTVGINYLGKAKPPNTCP